MAIIKKIRKYFQSPAREKEAAAAYDLWAQDYDHQPDNLMLHLDQDIFSELILRISLENKVVIDIGCGTGRHWNRIMNQKPAQLVGYDVSSGMLMELKKKFPSAQVEVATDNQLAAVCDESVDVIVSTLTLAHIEDLGSCFRTWKRVLKSSGEILLTDFHPLVLARGGKRNFIKEGREVVIRNFVHTLESIKKQVDLNGLLVVYQTERFIDETVRHFYEKQNALAVYEQFRGMPIIYGLYLRRS